MSLTEPQIARFGRQILLTPVGGEGQRRLLEAGAVVVGEGLTMSTAAAYLAAGGTPVKVDAKGRGFPLPEQRQTLVRSAGTVAPAGHRRWGPGHRVAVGEKAVVAMAQGGCVRCFEATVAGLEPSSSDLESGDVESGDVESGDVESGDVESGDVESGDVESGDVESGDVESGDVESGDVESGDVESGALAALAWQRLVLELGDSLAAFNVPLIRCGEHA